MCKVGFLRPRQGSVCRAEGKWRAHLQQEIDTQICRKFLHNSCLFLVCHLPIYQSIGAAR